MHWSPKTNTGIRYDNILQQLHKYNTSHTEHKTSQSTLLRGHKKLAVISEMQISHGETIHQIASTMNNESTIERLSSRLT